MKAQNIVGEKYNNYTVIRRVGTDKFRRAMWECRCDCGSTVIMATQELRARKNTHHCRACGRLGPAPKLLEYDGEKGTCTYWSAVFGVPVHTIYARKNHGWTDADAVSKPVRPKRTMIFNG